MSREVKRHPNKTEPILLVGFLLMAIYYLGDAILHSVIFEEGSLAQQIMAPGSHELSIRLLAFCIIAVLVFYSWTHLALRRNLELALESALDRAEEEKDKCQAIIAGIGDGISIQDRNFKILYQNQAHQMLVGGDYVGESCYRIYRHREEVCENCPVALSFEDGMVHQKEMAVSVGGRDLYLDVTASPLRENGDEIVGGVEVVRDITARKREEEALLVANRQLREEIAHRERVESERDRLFESSIDMFAVGEISGPFRQVNPAWRKILGWAEGELLGRPYLDFVHPEDREATLAAGEVLRAGRKLRGFENRYRCRDGSYRWFSWNAFPLPEEGLAFGVARDITERKRVEEALRSSEARLKAIHDNIAAGIAMLDRQGRYLEINAQLLGMLGYAREEVIGLTPIAFTHPADRERCEAVLNDILAGKTDSYRVEKRYCRKDGSIFWADVSVTRLPHQEDKPGVLIVIFVDISARKAVEEELIDANRELDAFVSTVSHDLRTPLTPIIGYAEFLREEYRERLDKRALDALTDIEKQGHKMLALMEDLLSLARLGYVERPSDQVDAGEVVRNVVGNLEKLAADCKITVPKEDLPRLFIPETFLAQVFENLLGNAVRYAGKEGCPIEVGGERSGAIVRFFVRDRGPGIPSEERSRIFTAFYRGSMRHKSRGTGLGLTTVDKIARLYGGRAWVEETPGGGSTFWVEMADAEPGDTPSGKSS